MKRTLTENFDAAVIGAGPAGSSAGLALTRAGFSVVLLEKARLPRYKTCGGGVLARARKWLPPEMQLVFERSFNSVALSFFGTNMNFVVRRQQPIVQMVMRADFDDVLARAAQTAGARLVESCSVHRVCESHDGVEIISAQGNFRAQFVIAADGVHSATAKSAGWLDLPALAPALEYEIFLDEKDFARFSEMPRFDFNTIDAGYAWIFPKRAHLSAGILSTRRVCPELQARLADYLRQLGITRIKRTEKHGYLIPLAPRRGPLARGRVLLAGDAAGLADPVTAEGISHAIQSGQLAARALMESGLDAARAGGIYQALLEENILSELRAARWLARILYRHPRLRHAAFRLNGQELCEFVAGVIAGERSYRAAMRQPASYWKWLGL